MNKIIAITAEIPSAHDIKVNPDAKKLAIPLPESAQILDVQPEAGGGSIKIYVEADEEEINKPDSWIRYHFMFFQTGDLVPKLGLGYLGTVQIGTSIHTWHLYIVESKR